MLRYLACFVFCFLLVIQNSIASDPDPVAVLFTVALDDEGSILINDNPVALEDLSAAFAAGSNNQYVIFRPSENTPMGIYQAVLKALRKTSIRGIAIVPLGTNLWEKEGLQFHPLVAPTQPH